MLRIVFVVGPSINDHTVATPALLIMYCALHMAWLAGPVPGGTAACLNVLMEERFANALSGWKWLCGVFGLCGRGLFLNSRNRFDFQVLGQPSSLVASVINLHLNVGRVANQWVSRRVTMRKDLDLWTFDASTPGHVTAAELAALRTRLLTPDGQALLQVSRCKVVAGLTPSGAPTDMCRLEFYWSCLWVPNSRAALLVGKVASGFLKPCWDDIITVKKRPTPPPPKAVGRKRAAADVSAAGAVAASARKRGGATGGGIRGSNPVEAAASFVPAPALSRVSGCTFSVVNKCAAWPRGAWSVQIPLDALFDQTSKGRVGLQIAIVSLPACEAGSTVGGCVKVLSWRWREP